MPQLSVVKRHTGGCSLPYFFTFHYSLLAIKNPDALGAAPLHRDFLFALFYSFSAAAEYSTRAFMRFLKLAE